MRPDASQDQDDRIFPTLGDVSRANLFNIRGFLRFEVETFSAARISLGTFKILLRNS